jgi:hypothetical protein
VLVLAGAAATMGFAVLTATVAALAATAVSVRAARQHPAVGGMHA